MVRLTERIRKDMMAARGSHNSPMPGPDSAEKGSGKIVARTGETPSERTTRITDPSKDRNVVPRVIDRASLSRPAGRA